MRHFQKADKGFRFIYYCGYYIQIIRGPLPNLIFPDSQIPRPILRGYSHSTILRCDYLVRHRLYGISGRRCEIFPVAIFETRISEDSKCSLTA